MPRIIFLALLFGVLLGLSWPTNGFTPFIFIAFVPLLLLFDLVKLTNRWSFFGYFSIGFFVWNAITTWWLWNATVFGLFFAMLLNTLLMSSIMLLWRRVDLRLGTKA